MVRYGLVLSTGTVGGQTWLVRSGWLNGCRCGAVVVRSSDGVVGVVDGWRRRQLSDRVGCRQRLSDGGGWRRRWLSGWGGWRRCGAVVVRLSDGAVGVVDG